MNNEQLPESNVESIKTKPRKIQYDGHEFPDPGPQFTNEQIKTHLTTVYPELANARIVVKDNKDGAQEVLFEKVAGTKGCE